jgi:hypothetical protein
MASLLRRTGLATALALVLAACGDDGSSTDSPDARTGAGDVDASVAADAAAEATADAASAADATTDAVEAPDAGPVTPPLPRWGTMITGDYPSMARIGSAVHVLARIDSPRSVSLYTLDEGRITATTSLPAQIGALATDGTSLYVQLSIWGVQELWGEATGAAGTPSEVVVKLGADGRPVWRFVDTSASISSTGNLRVGRAGPVMFRITYRESDSYRSVFVALDSATGTRVSAPTLTGAETPWVSDTGKVFVSGYLSAGSWLESHRAEQDEWYLAKLNGSRIGFAQFFPTSRQMIGFVDGDPVMVGRSTAGRRELSRHNGATGATIWTTTYDEVPSYFPTLLIEGDGALYLAGSFDDRIDFSPSLRVETRGDFDIYLAKVDPVTGAFRAAHQIGSASHDIAAALDVAGCPVLLGKLGGELTSGADVLGLARGAAGTFAATACF